MTRLVAAGCMAAMLASTAPLSAKGPTVRLVVAGGNLVEPVTIVDINSLRAFSVYGGEFLGSTVIPRNAQAPRYEVSFYVELPQGRGVHKKYVVYYTRSTQAGDGYIYLPGPGEDGYRLNGSTILRDGAGKWHRASTTWSAMLDHYLP